MESCEIKFFKDMQMMKVFELMLLSPKSAQQISDESKIPISTVYRKIKKLEDKGLILTKGILQNGVKTKIYKKKDSKLMEVNN